MRTVSLLISHARDNSTKIKSAMNEPTEANTSKLAGDSDVREDMSNALDRIVPDAGPKGEELYLHRYVEKFDE